MVTDLRVLCIVVACLAQVATCRLPLAAGDFGQPERGAASLRLRGGDAASGRLLASPDASLLNWQSPWFAGPFSFPLQVVDSIRFPSPDETPLAPGQFGFDLSEGDRLYGSVVGIDADRWLLATGSLGVVQLDRSRIRRVFSWQDGRQRIYDGPGRMDVWRFRSPESDWQFDGSSLATSEPMAEIRGDLQIPPQAHVELQLSWTDRPDFVLALGIDPTGMGSSGAFKFEVWDHRLVLVRELADRAAVASVATLADGPGQIRLSVILDQTAGRAVVLSSSGQRLADLHLPDTAYPARSGMQLQNVRGDVRLDALQITRGGPAPTSQSDPLQSRMVLIDGSVIRGPIVQVDTADARWIVLEEEHRRTIDADDIAVIYFSAADRQDPPTRDRVAARPVRVTTHDGLRLSGELQQMQPQRVQLQAHGVDRPITFPVTDLHSLAILPSLAAGADDPPPAASGPVASGRREGRLQLPGTRLRGRLVDSRPAVEQPHTDTTPLIWQPRGSRSTSSLRTTASGRIIYDDAAPPGHDDEPGGRRPRLPGGWAASFPGGAFDPGATAHTLFLRSGDTFVCRVQRITERGIAIGDHAGGATWVPHSAVQAVELSRPYKALDLEPDERQRLLTVPRMQRDDPPQHLLVSTQGDCLRGRLVSLDDQHVVFATPLRSIQVPRVHIATIIWIDDPAAEDAAGTKSLGVPGRERERGLRIQALRKDASRLTFTPTAVTDGTLIGISETLGRCSVPLSGLDQLVLGDAIQPSAASSAFDGWTLRMAPGLAADFNAEESAGGAAPRVGKITTMGGGLVGEPAPDFQLSLLDGSSFRLSDQRGKIIVLDFWASWCAPCMQRMPQVSETVARFADSDVRLVTVNLQETAEQIRATLARHGLTSTVALDLEGTVASRYQAEAIPHTAVIDRDGTVLRLLVGGGQRSIDQLRQILQNAADPPS